MRPWFVGCVAAALLLLTWKARAETWQAPVGGNALALGPGRVVCAGTAGDWSIEQDGHALRPPSTEQAIGRTVEAKLAANEAACTTVPAPLTLVATGRLPILDSSSTTLFVDDARIDLRGRGLKGAVVHWEVGNRSGVDRCVQPQADGAVERCTVAVGRGLPADPMAADLDWLPAGGHAGSDVVTWDATGRRVPADETRITPARIVVATLVPPDVSIDLAGGTSSRIPLVHPEAIMGADCGAASCTVSGNGIVVGGLANVSSAANMTDWKCWEQSGTRGQPPANRPVAGQSVAWAGAHAQADPGGRIACGKRRPAGVVHRVGRRFARTETQPAGHMAAQQPDESLNSPSDESGSARHAHVGPSSKSGSTGRMRHAEAIERKAERR